jgi:tRNA uridine 5-carboxymethylaminomethyl modification enzyme
MKKRDAKPDKFSYSDVTSPLIHQRSCHMTYTSLQVHDILEVLTFSMFNGRIKSLGPRYCPSIEDKINRLLIKKRHQLFIEPEGWKPVRFMLMDFYSLLQTFSIRRCTPVGFR